MNLALHPTLRPSFGLLLAATISGALLFPPEVRAAEPPSAPAAEPPFDPSPLPPIEPPRKPEAPAAAPPPEEPAAALALEPPTKEEKRSPACLLLQVGAFTSDVDAGLVADAGLRVKAFSARWAYRLMFSESAEGSRQELALNSGRLAWHKEFSEWTGGYVGAGVGSLEARAESPWDGELMTIGTATVMVLDAGLLVEYGPVSLFALGLELLIPAGGNVRSSPSVLLTATVSPLVILAAWK